MISLALLTIVTVIEPNLDRAKEEARQILADDKYGFCHDPKYPLTDTEAAWCPPVGPEHNPRCPAFRRACDAPRAIMQDLGRLSFSRDGGEGDGKPGGDQDPVGDEAGDGDGDKTGGTSGKRKQPRREVVAESEPALPELGGAGYVMFWLILGAGVLLLIYVIARNSTRHRADDAAAPEQPAAPELGPAIAPGTLAQEQLVRDVGALLEQARTAASAGDFARAIQRVHAALLHRLDHDGLIRVAPFRTNGDYVRDLKQHPELRSSVREIVREVEQIQFGTTRPDATLYDRVMKRVVPIATRRGETLLLLLGLTLFACELAKSYPFDRSPSGASAVIELGARYNLDIKFRTTLLADLDPGEDLGPDDHGRTLVLLHDTPPPTASEWRDLLLWAANGHHLVLAGVSPPAELGVRLDHGDVAHELVVGEQASDRLGALDLISPDDGTLVLVDSGLTLLERTSGEPYAVQYERGYRGGEVSVFADDRLFTSGALMLRDNPELLVRFFKELGASDIELADGLLDLGADTPAEAIANTHLTAFIVQLLALLAILYFWRGVTFGRPHDPPSRSRRQFAEHVEALGSQYARARASRHAVRLYATWALDRLRERTQTSRQPGIYPLAQAVAGRTGDDENRVMETLAEASTLHADAGASKVAGRHLATTTDLRLMQDLARLVRLVGGPR